MKCISLMQRKMMMMMMMMIIIMQFVTMLSCRDHHHGVPKSKADR